MIPKQLFFIWLGDNKPNYVDFSVRTFKKVNPDFNVTLLHYNINTIENLNQSNCKNDFDICLYNCIQAILYKNKYKSAIKEYLSYKRKFCQILCNIYRLEILTKFGGIYLDCDTFPNKPFDDFLLNRKHFTAYTYHRFFDTQNRHKDCHFLGSIGNLYYDNYYKLEDNINTQEIGYLDNLEWNKKRLDFFQCKLEYKLDIDKNYIEHYYDFTWNPDNCRTPICKYDKDLYK